MICKNCGSVYSDDEQYCPNCGASKYDFEQQEYKEENNQPIEKEQYYSQVNDINNNENNALYITLGFVFLAVVIGIIFGVNYYINNSSKNLEKPTSYVLNYGGFDFDVPNEIIQDQEYDKALVLTDKDENWMIYFTVCNGNFEELKLQKGQFQEIVELKGYKSNPAEIRNVGGVDFVTMELEKNKEYCLGAFTKLNASSFAQIILKNPNNELDYSLLEKVAPIVKSVFMEEEVVDEPSEEGNQVEEGKVEEKADTEKDTSTEEKTDTKNDEKSKEEVSKE